jgi:hypothetical protein
LDGLDGLDGLNLADDGWMFRVDKTCVCSEWRF